MRPNPCFNLWKLLFGRLPVRANVIPDWRRDVASHQRRLKTQLPEDNEGAPTTSTTTTPNRFLRRMVLCAVQLIPIGPRKNISTLQHYILVIATLQNLTLSIQHPLPLSCRVAFTLALLRPILPQPLTQILIKTKLAVG